MGEKTTHLLIQQRRPTHLPLPQHLQIHPLLRRHKSPSTPPHTPPKHPAQKRPHPPLILPDNPLQNPLLTAKLQLVAEIRQSALGELARGDERPRARGVGRRDAEDGGNQVGLPLRHAVDDSAAPVVAAQDDAGRVGGARDGGDGVGMGEEGVVLQVGGEALVQGSC